MQSKGVLKFLAIVLALACLWQLSFTVATKVQEKKAADYAEKIVEATRADAEAFAKIPVEEQSVYLDGVRDRNTKAYLDSISNKKVYLGYTYDNIKTKEINLGLDLKGGMNVMLQVQLEDLIKALTGSRDPRLDAALAEAKKINVTEGDFITAFQKAWEAQNGDAPLAPIFATLDAKDKVNAHSTNAEVYEYIRGEAKSAIDNSFNVLRNRIDKFGVTQPSIQKIGNSGRILVELPGVKEPERVRKLLQGTASLEFWTTYKYSEISGRLQEADRYIRENLQPVEEEAAPAEEAETEIDSLEQARQAEAKAIEQFRKQYPLLSLLNSGNGMNPESACIGYVASTDTAQVNAYLADKGVLAVLGGDEFKALWSVKPVKGSNNMFELVAIHSTLSNGKAPLDGDAVTDARVEYDARHGGYASVSMSMNASGANTWANLTRENVKRQVAIVLDGQVYSYPTVQNEITGGNSSITGDFSQEEAQDLANVLKSGKLPAPATIIQESVVGPSLGAESINAGMISFAIAFLLVLVYMILFYQGAGLVADIALLCNVLLLFGTLVSFGAVLTLPGIAGLVLTLGMAVDANVIIYERIKEELASGKGLSLAVKDGYSNAYSAIIDGQVTTLLTGLVLFFFGSGPVQGFATTLIIGIITSVLTSIFITRIIIDDRLQKGKGISFDNKVTRNFLKNTHANFLGGRKWSYLISGTLIVIAIVSMATKGFTYGVDFTGGRTYVVKFDQPVNVEQAREAVNDVFAEASEKIGEKSGAVEVKQYGGVSQIKLTTQYKNEEEGAEVDEEVSTLLFNALKGFFKDTDITYEDFRSTQTSSNGIVSSDRVGPSIANDIKRDAIIAVLLALLVIFGYIAIRFKNWTWGLGGVVSLAHTAIIVIGFFSLFSGILPFNLDVDQTFIAAILTIIGYAINDNVVIFDRIREFKTLHPKADFGENVNSALNSTLTRTVNTSVSTLVTMLAIAIWGGETIRGLAVALILGVCIGTYASIMIGTPVMYDVTRWAERRKEAKTARK